jgi:hypothetical protein
VELQASQLVLRKTSWISPFDFAFRTVGMELWFHAAVSTPAAEIGLDLLHTLFGIDSSSMPTLNTSAIEETSSEADVKPIGRSARRRPVSSKEAVPNVKSDHGFAPPIHDISCLCHAPHLGICAHAGPVPRQTPAGHRTAIASNSRPLAIVRWMHRSVIPSGRRR